MKTKLRGKKLNIMKPQTKYAKVPLEVLSHPVLTPVDKLIITFLYSQSDSGNYILAYTRIAKELNISKKWIIARWKWLKQNNYILENDQNYFIVIGMQEEELRKLKETLKIVEENIPIPNKSKGEVSSPKLKLEGEQNKSIGDITQVNKIHPIGEDSTPTIGEHNTPTKENRLYLNGEVTPPNEYNKEEKKKSEYKIEQGSLALGSVPQKSCTSPAGCTTLLHTPTGVRENRSNSSVLINNTPTKDLENSDNVNESKSKNIVEGTLPKVNVEKVVPKVSAYVYNGIDIQEEIRQYHSNLFKEYNYQYVCDIYNDFKKETNLPTTLKQFDSLIWFHSFNIWKAENPNEQPTNEYINLFIKNNLPRVLPNDLIALIRSFNKRQEIRDIFNNEVLKLKIIIPVTIPKPPRVFTQQELDNYEDLPI